MSKGRNLLWAPWRLAYVRQEEADGCIFCQRAAEAPDVRNLILRQGEKCFVMLNAYPYNNGHAMIAPKRHVADWEELTDDEAAEVVSLIKVCLRALRKALNPDGFNVGLNLGEVAGAGIADHLHLHIVPRWNGDTNFMPILAATKVIPQHLEECWEELREKMEGDG